MPIIEPQKRGCHFVPFSPHQRMRFRRRTTVERVFSRLKDEFGGRFIRVRGAAKVLAHLMFGLLALTADQILRLGGVPIPPPTSTARLSSPAAHPKSKAKFALGYKCDSTRAFPCPTAATLYSPAPISAANQF